jgi:hypothetical protein
MPMIALRSQRSTGIEGPTASTTSKFEPSNLGLSTSEGIRRVIEAAVSSVFDVDIGLLRQPTRGQARVAVARQVAMYVAHAGYGLSLTEVGDLFERDRTTVAHACRVVEQRRDQPGFDKGLELLEQIVRVLAGAGTGHLGSRGAPPG